MLKTSRSTKPLTRLGEGVVGVGSDSKARRDAFKLDGSEFDGDEVDSGEVEVDEIGKKVQKTTKSKNSSTSKKAIGPWTFLSPELD